ncbi:GtrA family protein [Streptomyces sp. NPDC047725]|uniref:GtrA family protein n=1 Tax=Streptomyces sp. NPDC047725 TaxID=3365487 RepID=UPI00371203D3
MARLRTPGRAGARTTAGRRPVRVPDSGEAAVGAAPERGVLSREVVSFAAIGVLSTAGQALLYWLLRTWWPPAAANLVSLLVLTVLNTEANRRLTFRHAPVRAARAHLGAGGLFLLGYLATSGAVLWFRHADPGASPGAETVVLTVASVVVTVVRFAVLRLAVFRGPARRGG